MQSNLKHDIIRFEKYMKPSGCCQICQSQAQHSKDCIITCDICRSCIHQTHYGSQLLQPPESWQCERCRYFLQYGPSDIACQFCPNLRGIMKQYEFQKRKIWLHPECAAWGYPIIFFINNKKEAIKKQKPKSESTNFWVPDYQVNPYPCQVCKSMSGYRLKCKYYSCKKSYHVTCARPEGIVRDLQSMKQLQIKHRIENGPCYFPVYCKQHIQLKIQDCKKRVKLLKQKGDMEKATHFQKIGYLFDGQLKNLQAAVKKCKLEQQMIRKMSIETRRNIQTNDNASFSQLDESFSSQQQQEFIKMLEQQMMDEQLPLKPIQQIKIVSSLVPSAAPTQVKQPSAPRHSGLEEQRPRVRITPMGRQQRRKQQKIEVEAQASVGQKAAMAYGGHGKTSTNMISNINGNIISGNPNNGEGNYGEQRADTLMEDEQKIVSNYQELFQNY